MSLTGGVVALAILVVSVVLHENAHGWVALALGDETARSAGRLTLNPLKHLDPVGSLILPALLYFTAGTMFGYARPVPVSPRKLKGGDRWGFALVALAGPLMNLAIAWVAAWLARTQGVEITAGGIRAPLSGPGFVAQVLVVAFELNVFLAAFNLIPVPPLDGSRLLRPFLGTEGRRLLDRVEPFGFVIMLVLIVWLAQPLFRLVGLIHGVLLHLLPL